MSVFRKEIIKDNMCRNSVHNFRVLQDLNMCERKADLSFLEEETQIMSKMEVWHGGLITAVHTCFVANSEIIHVAKRKGAVIF